MDKSLLIKPLNALIGTDECYVCITRPRRFGKTVNANMLGAYYTKGYDSRELFSGLAIAKEEVYLQHLNQHNVIYIDFSRMLLVVGIPAVILELKLGKSCEEAIAQIKDRNYMQQVQDYSEILLVGISYNEKKYHQCKMERYIK